MAFTTDVKKNPNTLTHNFETQISRLLMKNNSR